MTQRPLSGHEAACALAQDNPEESLRRQLEECEQLYRQGERRALAVAIQLCGGCGAVLPAWAAEAFNEGLRQIVECEISSWDEVLGPGNPRTPKRLATARRNRARSVRIVELLPGWRRRGGQVGREMFLSIWETLRTEGDRGITTDQVQKLYYALPEGVRLPAVTKRPGGGRR